MTYSIIPYPRIFRVVSAGGAVSIRTALTEEDERALYAEQLRGGPKVYGPFETEAQARAFPRP